MKIRVLMLLLLSMPVISYSQGKDCSCEPKEISLPTYAPLLSTLSDYDHIPKLTQWTYGGEDNFYLKSFYLNYQTDHNRTASFHSFELLTPSPVIIQNPDKSLTINLSPCFHKLEMLPLGITIEHTIKNYFPDFDWGEFNHTAIEYYEILISISEVDEDELIDKAFINSYDFVNLFEANQKIKQLYAFEIEPFENEENFVGNLRDAIMQNGISAYKLVFDILISEGGVSEKISYNEAERLTILFTNWLSYFSLDDIDEMLQPQFRISTQIYELGVTIDPAIIRLAKIKENGIEHGNLIKFISSKPITYSTKQAFLLQEMKACFSKAEITGTGVVFKFEKADLYISGEHDKLFVSNPFIFPTANDKNENAEFFKAVKNFTGIHVQKAKLTFPIGKIIADIDANEIFLNNFFISGSFNLKAKRGNKESEYYVIVNGSEQNINLQKLIEHYMTKNFQLSYQDLGEEIVFHFYFSETKK